MTTTHDLRPTTSFAAPPREPVFGCIILGGAVNGATIRDVRLANELVRRGYRVHVWWVMDRPRSHGLDPRIEQHWLFHGLRYVGRYFPALKDGLGKTLQAVFSDSQRAHLSQAWPGLLDRVWQGHLRLVCGGIERDSRLTRRFARAVARAGVTHMLPALAVLSPWAAAAKRIVPQQLRYVVTFQGYEIYVKYARQIGLERQFYVRVADLVRQSDWPAIAVSDNYANRIVSDVGLSRDELTVIPPGVPTPERMEHGTAVELLRKEFPTFNPDVPLVSFVGRRDSEKGIDLLLYATKILRRNGHRLQVYICGATAFGHNYATACRQIAESLPVPAVWRGYVSDNLRTALYTASRFVVYPSIHREPFGMVPVEAMSHGTPAIVPNAGGVANAIRAGNKQGGLRFRAWDSGSLACQMAQLLEGNELHSRLSKACRTVAEHYSVANCAVRLLAHLGIETGNQLVTDQDDWIDQRAA